MKAKITGMSQYQGQPLASSTLTLYRHERYEDGSDRATVYREDFIFDPTMGTRGTWRDRHTGGDAYTVVSGPDDPAPVEGVFEETFRYADGTHVTTIFRLALIGTSVAGTELNYTTAQNPSTSTEPLTMQAAREVLTSGGASTQRVKALLSTPRADLLADAVRTFVIDLPANSFLKRYCAVLGMTQAQTNECEVKFYEAGDVGNPTAWDDMRYHAKFGTHGDQFLTTDTTEGPEYIDASGNKKLRVWAKNTGANTIQQFGLSIEIAYGG